MGHLKFELTIRIGSERSKCRDYCLRYAAGKHADPLVLVDTRGKGPQPLEILTANLNGRSLSLGIAIRASVPRMSRPRSSIS